MQDPFTRREPKKNIIKKKTFKTETSSGEAVKFGCSGFHSRRKKTTNKTNTNQQPPPPLTRQQKTSQRKYVGRSPVTLCVHLSLSVLIAVALSPPPPPPTPYPRLPFPHSRPRSPTQSCARKNPPPLNKTRTFLAEEQSSQKIQTKHYLIRTVHTKRSPKKTTKKYQTKTKTNNCPHFTRSRRPPPTFPHPKQHPNAKKTTKQKQFHKKKRQTHSSRRASKKKAHTHPPCTKTIPFLVLPFGFKMNPPSLRAVMLRFTPSPPPSLPPDPLPHTRPTLPVTNSPFSPPPPSPKNTQNSCRGFFSRCKVE